MYKEVTEMPIETFISLYLISKIYRVLQATSPWDADKQNMRTKMSFQGAKGATPRKVVQDKLKLL